jgi:hypothetical protein
MQSRNFFDEFSLRFGRGDFADMSANKEPSYIKTLSCHRLTIFAGHHGQSAATAVEHESRFAGDVDEGNPLDQHLQASWGDSVTGKGWKELRSNELETCKDWQTCFSVGSTDRPLRSAERVAFVNEVAARERVGASQTEAFCTTSDVA